MSGTYQDNRLDPFGMSEDAPVYISFRVEDVGPRLLEASVKQASWTFAFGAAAVEGEPTSHTVSLTHSRATGTKVIAIDGATAWECGMGAAFGLGAFESSWGSETFPVGREESHVVRAFIRPTVAGNGRAHAYDLEVDGTPFHQLQPRLAGCSTGFGSERVGAAAAPAGAGQRDTRSLLDNLAGGGSGSSSSSSSSSSGGGGDLSGVLDKMSGGAQRRGSGGGGSVGGVLGVVLKKMGGGGDTGSAYAGAGSDDGKASAGLRRRASSGGAGLDQIKWGPEGAVVAAASAMQAAGYDAAPGANPPPVAAAATAATDASADDAGDADDYTTLPPTPRSSKAPPSLPAAIEVDLVSGFAVDSPTAAAAGGAGSGGGASGRPSSFADSGFSFIDGGGASPAGAAAAAGADLTGLVFDMAAVAPPPAPMAAAAAAATAGPSDPWAQVDLVGAKSADVPTASHQPPAPAVAPAVAVAALDPFAGLS